MKAPIYLRKDPAGGGAYLHDAFDKHLGYVHSIEIAEALVSAVNAQQPVKQVGDAIHEMHMSGFAALSNSGQ